MDYAADTRGYTVGSTLEYDDRNCLRYGLFAMPIVAQRHRPGLGRSRRQNVEFELRHSFIAGPQRYYAHPELCKPCTHGQLSRSEQCLPQRHADATS